MTETAPFDSQPTLVGETVTLSPLRDDDWAALFAVAADPLIWEVHPAHDRWQEPVFRQFLPMRWNPAAALSSATRQRVK